MGRYYPATEFPADWKYYSLATGVTSVNLYAWNPTRYLLMVLNCLPNTCQSWRRSAFEDERDLTRLYGNTLKSTTGEGVKAILLDRKVTCIGGFATNR